MSINVNNNIIGSDKELSGRAQSDIIKHDDNSPTKSIQRSYFSQLERGPAKAPSKLDESYNLEESFNKAFSKAVNFANRVLLDDDLAMSLQHDEHGESLAVVENTETSKIVQEYNPVQVLQMYSSNYNLQGIVIDALI